MGMIHEKDIQKFDSIYLESLVILASQPPLGMARPI